MWPFKRKNSRPESQREGPLCSYCKSTHTRAIVYHGSDQPDYIRTWRGKRYCTCKCLSCGRDFYTEEPDLGLLDAGETGDVLIDDEEELHAAEEKLKKEVEDEGDRRCW